MKNHVILLFILFCLFWQLSLCYEEGQLISGQCEPQNYSLFYGNDNIYRLEKARLYLRGPDVRGKQLFDRESYSPIISMTYDQQKQNLYYVDAEHSKRIYSYNITNKTMSHFDQNAEKFKEIAVELLTGNIYFISQTKDIGVCSFDLQKCIKLIARSDDQPTKYRNLVLHTDGRMFWIESHGLDVGQLWVANTDGSYMQKVSGFDRVSSITLNITNSLMYLSTENELVQLNLATIQHKRVKYIEESVLFYLDCYLLLIERYGEGIVFYNSMFQAEWGNSRDAKDPNILMAIETKYDLPDRKTNPCTKLTCSGLCVLVTNKDSKTKVKCIEEKSSFPWIFVIIGVFILSFALIFSVRHGLVQKLRACFRCGPKTQTQPLSVMYKNNKSDDQK